MTNSVTSARPFKVGTTGWSADDLDDPQVERLWGLGKYEIVEGVLTEMPAAYYEGSIALKRLFGLVERYLADRDLPGEFAPEVDLVLARRRVPRVDAVFLRPEDLRRQEEANQGRGRRKLRFGRIRIVPPLVIESVSLGHEEHDRETKRRWYAEAGLPNYWLLNAYDRTLECLVLKEGAYQIDQTGKGDDEVQPTLFPGLVIPLKKLWAI